MLTLFTSSLVLLVLNCTYCFHLELKGCEALLKLICSFYVCVFDQTIAETVGDWYFSRRLTNKEIDCAYPCGTNCHNLIP